MIESRFIEKLLNGREVEWKPLGNILTRTKGTKITAGQMKALHKENAPIKIFAGGKTFALVNFGDIPEKDINKNPSIIVKSRGIIEFEYYDKVFSHKNEMWSYYSQNERISTKYIYYFLKQNEPYFQNIGSKMQMPQIAIPDTDKFLVPIPPLDVQQEIVRILDAFTSLTAELTAELTSRQKQYQYFRDKLLNFDDISDRGGYETNPITKALLHNKEVVFKALGNISENLDFMRKPITSGLREKGNIPYYGASGIVDYVKDYIFEGDYLLVSEDGANLLARNTPIAFSISGKNWVNNHAHVLKFNTYTERRFVEFYLNNIDLTPYISGASQPKLNKNNLSNIKIPAPPFEEQQRIVTILDKFETLTNSIAEGLPKEIELRRKQYEYYREQLLSFSQ